MKFKHLLLAISFSLNLLIAGFAQEPTLLEHGGGVRTVEFSPVNASLVASAGESNLIKLWNLKNNTARTLREHTDIVSSVAFSPNGNLLASVSDDRTIKLWNVHNSQNIATLREGTQFVTVAFSPDGQLLATGGWMHVKLWDVRRRVVIATLQHDKFVRAVTFSHDGKLLAVGDVRESSGTVKVWDVKSRRVVATLKDDLVVVRSVTFSSDDRYLASSHYNGEVKVWNVSDWELLRTMPAGDYDIAFSPDAKMIAGTGNGSVNLWWVEDGTKVAQLPGPAGWMHPVDFSHDGASLAVGGEEGIVRIWRINTSFGDNNNGGIQILHTDTYLQQLPKANSANGDNIPDPAPPTAVVREFFELDLYYEQWINVGGLPVIASAKVNPYALKEAAWLIERMIGHRPDVLRAMVKNKARLSVIPYTEVITEIPEYRSYPTPDFLAFGVRGAGGSEGATVSASEESILDYPGETETFNRGSSILIHEFGHAIHLLGFNIVDPTFDERLRMTYEAAMQKGLWQGTYASVDRREYWAEGTMAWFYPNGSAGSFARFGNTRRALKEYDPALATLLAEVWGDREWRYTPVATRTHLPHLLGFNPQDSPDFEWWPELIALEQQLRDPNSDGDGAWMNLKPYNPDQLSRLIKSNVLEDLTTIVYVNFTQADVLLYEVTSDGTEHYWTRCAPGGFRFAPTRVNTILLVKNLDGRNIVVFQTGEQTGRAVIGTPPNKTDQTARDNVVIPKTSTDPVVSSDVNGDGIVNILDLVLVSTNFGKTGQNPADVNGDGVVNIVDLVKVAGEMGTSAAAPSVHPQTLEILTATDVRQWLAQAQYADLTDATSQRGILLLEQLLTTLIPKETSLLPNYPNPFNPETWMPYQLSKPADVTLRIYAVNGTLIRVLALGHQPAGMYHSKTRAAYWDGKNELGEAVASSIYFYTLSAGGFTSTRKMLIQK